jgi:hypothetical protein
MNCHSIPIFIGDLQGADFDLEFMAEGCFDMCQGPDERIIAVVEADRVREGNDALIVCAQERREVADQEVRLEIAVDRNGQIVGEIGGHVHLSRSSQALALKKLPDLFRVRASQCERFARDGYELHALGHHATATVRSRTRTDEIGEQNAIEIDD